MLGQESEPGRGQIHRPPGDRLRPHGLHPVADVTWVLDALSSTLGRLAGREPDKPKRSATPSAHGIDMLTATVVRGLTERTDESFGELEALGMSCEGESRRDTVGLAWMSLETLAFPIVLLALLGITQDGVGLVDKPRIPVVTAQVWVMLQDSH